MIDFSSLQPLRAVGLNPAVMQQLAAQPDTPGLQLLRVTEVQREGLTLHDGHQAHAARQLPALRQALADDADALAVGDWVLAQRNAFGEWWVQQRLPPINQLARRLHDGRDKVERVVIVSNVDTALLVMGLTEDFNLRRLERYLALVRLAGVTPVVVLSKRDLCAPALAQQRLAQVQGLLPPEASAVALDGTHADDVRAVLQPWLVAGNTLVLLGSSGAGKSTLTNALTGALTGALTSADSGGAAAQLTGGVRGGDGRGRHTTTARSLHATPEGACIIDTPGLRSLRLDGDEQRLNEVFDDVAQLAQQCRFRDCSHHDEPGCAVRPAVASERLSNYHKLQREARRDQLTALERKAQVSAWKARGREARLRIQAKRS